MDWVLTEQELHGHADARREDTPSRTASRIRRPAAQGTGSPPECPSQKRPVAPSRRSGGLRAGCGETPARRRGYRPELPAFSSTSQTARCAPRAVCEVEEK